VLYVSPIFYYKNHLNVVKALQKLRDNTNINLNLTFVGGGGSSCAYFELEEYLISNNLNGFITIKDYVDTNQLLDEYSNSDLFVFASSSETFGITLLEAMGAKLPIACSDKTGLPELLKDAGVYFDPFDVSSIERALMNLLQSQTERENLGLLAFHYAKGHTWNDCTNQTFNFLRAIYSENQKRKLKY
jgi:glycosyltransferase involved in cell wall biosynthesis